MARRKRKPLTAAQARRAELIRLRRAIKKRHRRQVRTVRRQERRAATRQAAGARKRLHKAEVRQRGKRRKELSKLRRKIRRRYAKADQRERRKLRRKATRARRTIKRRAHKKQMRLNLQTRQKATRTRQRERVKLKAAETKTRQRERAAQSKARLGSNRARSRADQAYQKATAKVVNDQIKAREGIIAAAIRRIGNLRGAEISTGLTGAPGAANHGGPGETVASVAYANEYGIGVPERPFMRITNARERRNWVRLAGQIVSGQAKGAETQERGVRRLGLIMVRDFKRTIRDGVSPPNSPAWIEEKGSSKTLINTGQMINSIRADISLPDGTRELIA